MFASLLEKYPGINGVPNGYGLQLLVDGQQINPAFVEDGAKVYLVAQNTEIQVAWNAPEPHLDGGYFRLFTEPPVKSGGNLVDWAMYGRALAKEFPVTGLISETRESDADGPLPGTQLLADQERAYLGYWKSYYPDVNPPGDFRDGFIIRPI